MANPVFELESVSVTFGSRRLFDGLSLSVPDGGKLVLRGASGSGKSTVLRLLLGFVQPSAGTVRFRGEEMSPEVAWRLRRETAYVSQSPDFGPGSVLAAIGDLVALGATAGGIDRGQIARAAGGFGLAPALLDQEVGELSGGERQRVALAGATLLGRSIVLLDEPTAALDIGLKRQVAELVLGRDDWTVVAVAHDEAWFGGSGVSVVDVEGGR